MKQQPINFIHLTDQQKRFCQEYVVNFNAYQSAISAGYSENTARKGELLHVPKIQDYLKAMMDQTADRLQITHDMILRELAKVAFSNIGDYYDYRGTPKRMCELSESEKAALSYYQILDAVDDTGHCYGSLHKIKLHNKMAALDKIARHLNFYGTGGKSEQERSSKQRQEILERKEEEMLEGDVAGCELPVAGNEELDGELFVVNSEGVLEDVVLQTMDNETGPSCEGPVDSVMKILTISPLEGAKSRESRVKSQEKKFACG